MEKENDYLEAVNELKKQYDTSVKKSKTKHLSEEKKLATLKENKLIQEELEEEEKQAIELDYKKELIRLGSTCCA